MTTSASPPSAIFWDVGGVLLSNGWDRHARRAAVEQFDLDPEEYRDRHDLVVRDFETGRISLDHYLTCTVFHRDRQFSRSEFKRFMFARSKPYPETLAIVARLGATGSYLQATLNNESLELNHHRIERFRLKRYFDLFFCSCFLGVSKPEEPIYRIALQTVQREPAECLFIDDRELNVERAAALGIRTIHYRDPRRLLGELTSSGVTVEQGD